MSLTLKIDVYGKLSDELGNTFEVVLEQGSNVADLRDVIAQFFLGTEADTRDSRVLFCIGNEIVPDSFVLSGQESIEILSPVSGG